MEGPADSLAWALLTKASLGRNSLGMVASIQVSNKAWVHLVEINILQAGSLGRDRERRCGRSMLPLKY